MRRLLIFLFSLVASVSLYATNRALLVGIGSYDTEATGWSVIHGNNDIALLEPKLKAKGFTVITLSDKYATKSKIVGGLKKMLAMASAGDIVYIHFSGHGQLIEDLNNDEQEEYDQSFVCYDACFSPRFKSNGSWYKGQNHLIDDELFPYLNQIKQKIGKEGELVVVFDSCYSGGADRGEVTDDPDPEGEVEIDDTTRGASDEFKLNKSSETYLRRVKKPGQYSDKGSRVVVISACESDKKNYECKERRSGRKYGSLSYCIGKILDNNIPLSQWSAYFQNGDFRKLKIFRLSQNPVTEVYK